LPPLLHFLYRQKCFDDFIAIAEDLIKRKITSPKHLGIEGGSNGGLLVGATFTQRPDLFNAVLCAVPLLDMLNYHTMLAGNSWISEYGNPDDPKMHDIIKKYSPYHNVEKGKEYPEVLFMTSTHDDRVHPAHARKMVDKMESQGHKVYLYENTEGGHGGASNLKQNAYKGGLKYSYLEQKLMNKSKLSLAASAPTLFAVKKGETPESVDAVKPSYSIIME
jgi:prolyl oligopeptidase